MKNALKWDFELHLYSNIEISDNCKCEADFEELIECPQCGVVFKFKNSYTSRQIHNKYGFGYAVCPQCYYSELQEWQKAEGKATE